MRRITDVEFCLEDDPVATTTATPSRRVLGGTPQQERFWAELAEGDGHVMLVARAGTGKSTSCREGMWRLIERKAVGPVRYCCFNKKIADEFAAACPPGVEVGTMHRFGLQACLRALGGSIDSNKTYQILDAMGEDKLPRYVRKAISTLVSLAKNAGLRPAATGDDEAGNALFLALWDLVDLHDLPTYNTGDLVVDLAADVLGRSLERAASIDFDDMLWLPVLLGLPFPPQDLLFIDEAQDLNPIQHELVDRLAGGGRVVVVGDPCQAIYGFRGADSRSMGTLADRLAPVELPLTVTFRCPTSHVRLANELVPDLEAAPGNPEGELLFSADAEGALADVEAGDLVLCRKNAPLISACLRLIADRRRATMRGRAIGEQLLTVVRRQAASTIADFVAGVDRWEAKELDRLSRRDGVEHLVEQVRDKALSLHAIAGSCGSPAEIPGVIDQLFRDDDPAGQVTFGSVHRAKGSEARRVTFLDVPYAPSPRGRTLPAWEGEQRRNLRYVALTRSLERLHVVAVPA
jgi:DNA helicase II / ATP-dependent DNA helicase PcrA